MQINAGVVRGYIRKKRDKKFGTPVIEIAKFNVADVITASTGFGDANYGGTGDMD